MNIGQFPKRVTIELTNKCNLTCSQCPQRYMDSKLGEMSPDLWRKIIKEIRGHDILAVPFWRGEPFMHSHFRKCMEELLDVCLEYPMLGDILAFNNVQDGIEGVKNNFNGIYELLLRTNCSQVLIDRYVNTSPKDFQESWSLFKKGDYSFKIMVLELLIAQPEITSRLNVEQKKTLISNLIEKKVDKSNPEIYGRTSHMTVYFTISKVLISDAIYYELTKDLMDDVVKLSTSGNLKATSLVPQIHQLAIAYINDNSL